MTQQHTLTCSCGYRMAIDSSLVGKWGKCGRCGTMILAGGEALQVLPHSITHRPRARVWSVGETVANQLQVISVLGEGGMGTVYLVRDKRSGVEYAAKRSLVADQAERDALLRELATWADLPPHENLTRCYRPVTLEDGIIILAEHVAGGTLADWIEAGTVSALPHIIDIALQFAWGLHIAHAHGIVHGDVKPQNVLMTPDGDVKVSDFGIARFIQRGHLAKSGTPAVPAACTPAYAAPEQLDSNHVTVQSDIWSWGLCVLEMVAGGRSWIAGSSGKAILASLMRQWDSEGERPLPPELRQLLERCFETELSNRWQDMIAPCNVLKEIYRKTTGHKYHRQLSLPARQITNAPDNTTKYGTTGEDLSDPRHWLIEALKAAGRNPSEALDFQIESTGSRKAVLVSQLRALERADRLFQECIDRGRHELRERLAALALHKASHLEALNDREGALAEFDRAIETYNSLVHGQKRQDIMPKLARAISNKAVALRIAGRIPQAIAHYERALPLLRELSAKGQETHQYAQTLLNYGVAIDTAADATRSSENLRNKAIEAYNTCIEICEREIGKGRASLFRDCLTRAYMNKGITLNLLGNHEEAVRLYSSAIQTYESLVTNADSRHLLLELARTRHNCAKSLWALKRKKEAMAEIFESVRTFDKLVHHDQREDLLQDLGNACVTKAGFLLDTGELRESLEAADSAISAYKEGLLGAGTGNRSILIGAYNLKASILRRMGDIEGAARVIEESQSLS